ncbi:MAG: ATP-binding protein [Planctomycetota bacterium]
MDYVPRRLTAAIERARDTFPAVLVTGARQSGKTTLLCEEYGGSHRYVSLERPEVRARAEADPVSFLRENGPPVILDEIQAAPELLHYVKERIDEERTPGDWLLTGSQSFGLMQGVSQTLAGRTAVFHLDPLSTGECQAEAASESLSDLLRGVFDGDGRDETGAPSLMDWLLRGGFPEPCLNPNVDRQFWFSSYLQTYLERDVRDLANVTDLGAFRRFTFLVAAQTGRILNMSRLGRELGVTGPTIKRWMSVLEASGVVHLLPPYHRNLGKRIRRSPKVILLDPGLATFLLGLHSSDAIRQGPTWGTLVETAVITEWVKACRQRGVRPDLFYWQSIGGQEVDLVMEQDGIVYGIEVKSTATPRPSHAAGLARWLEAMGPSARGALACPVEEPCSLREGIRAIPWHLP